MTGKHYDIKVHTQMGVRTGALLFSVDEKPPRAVITLVAHESEMTFLSREGATYSFCGTLHSSMLDEDCHLIVRLEENDTLRGAIRTKKGEMKLFGIPSQGEKGRM